MDNELFQYCKERGIPEYYAQKNNNYLRVTFDFQAWRLGKAWQAFCDEYVKSIMASVKRFLTWFVHGKRGW